MPSKENPKTMDVTRPGNLEPDASSRPVIVTHRPMVQDPMMKSEDKIVTTADEISKKTETKSYADKIIQPLLQEAVVDADPPEPALLETKVSSESQTPETSEAATVEAVANQSEGSRKKKDGEKTKEEKAKQESIEQLIADKKYFVPVGQAQRRRNQRTWALVLVGTVIVLLTGYAVVDAGLIKSNIVLPIDFIKN